MKLIVYLKSTLKGMFANGAVTLAYFVLFPVIVAGFMGFIQSSAHDNPLKLKKVTVQITDEDNSKMSTSLVDFLKSKEMEELVQIEEGEKVNCKLIIPKGYESSILSLKRDEIQIIKMDESRDTAIDTLKVILDKYHKSTYVGVSGGSQEELDKISNTKVVESKIIDVKENMSSYEKMSSSMIGFVITMLIYGLIQSSYSKISVDLDNKVMSTPITKLSLLIYNTAAYFIYSFIIIMAYVLVFRIAGINFSGSILSLTSLALVSSLLVTTLSVCVISLFGPKYGKVVAVVLFMVPIASMEMFSGVGNALAVLSPSHYIIRGFTMFSLNGNLVGVEKYIGIILAISVGLFIVASIKEILSKEGKKCV